MVQDHNEDGELGVWPDLLYWYPGLTLKELMRMPRGIVRIFIEALPRLQAEQEGMMIKGASFPHMDKKGQRRVINELNKETKRKTTPKQVTSVEETKELMAASGFAFEIINSSTEGNDS